MYYILLESGVSWIASRLSSHMYRNGETQLAPILGDQRAGRDINSGVSRIFPVYFSFDIYIYIFHYNAPHLEASHT